jgi:hypothetical protein
VAAHGVFMTRESCVVMWFTWQGLKLAQVTAKPSDMGDTCLLQSFNSNSTFIMLYMILEMDVSYLEVEEMRCFKIV